MDLVKCWPSSKPSSYLDLIRKKLTTLSDTELLNNECSILQASPTPLRSSLISKSDQLVTENSRPLTKTHSPLLRLDLSICGKTIPSQEQPFNYMTNTQTDSICSHPRNPETTYLNEKKTQDHQNRFAKHQFESTRMLECDQKYRDQKHRRTFSVANPFILRNCRENSTKRDNTVSHPLHNLSNQSSQSFLYPLSTEEVFSSFPNHLENQYDTYKHNELLKQSQKRNPKKHQSDFGTPWNNRHSRCCNITSDEDTDEDITPDDTLSLFLSPTNSDVDKDQTVTTKECSKDVVFRKITTKSHLDRSYIDSINEESQMLNEKFFNLLSRIRTIKSKALKNKTIVGEHVLWTADVSEELPIKMSKSGVGAAPPVTLIEAFAETVRKYPNKPALAYKPPALKAGKFRVFDWKQYWNECCRFAKALIYVGHQPRDRIIIMGAGSAFWHIAHFGTIFANGVSGSIYPTNGSDSAEYIIMQSGCIVAVVDTIENLEKVLLAKQSGRCPNIKHIVMYMEDPPEGAGYQSVWRWSDFICVGRAVSDSLLTERMEQQTPGLCCELVYTSGTTGIPKAVMLSHDNCLWTTFSLLQGIETVWSQEPFDRSGSLSTILSFFKGKQESNPLTVSAVEQKNQCELTTHSIEKSTSTLLMSAPMPSFSPSFDPSQTVLSTNLSFIHGKPSPIIHSCLPKTRPSSSLLANMVFFSSDERVVSFLPLSHIAPQIIDIYIPILSGCCVYFAQPDALRGSLIVTLQEVRPTFLFAVPRVYEKMEERIRAVGAQSTGLKKRFSDWVKSLGFRGTTYLLKGDQPPWMYNLLRSTVLKRIRVALGLDYCKAMASGAAPLQPTTQDYFLSLGMPICDMYGMSECTGPQTSNAAWPGWFKAQTAGVSLPGTEIVIDRPSADGVGEICYRGRNVFMGYYGNSEATQSTIDQDGFLHSGDIGYVDEDGFLKITGRLKELLITAGGENVAPVPIENLMKEEMNFISNCIVIGDRRKFLTMLVCLKSVSDSEGNPTNMLDPSLAELLKNSGSNSRTIYEATNDPIMRSIIEKGIERANKRAVSRAQRVIKFKIIPQDFTQVGGELTPTLKLKRNFVLDKYASIIDAIYAELENENKDLGTYGDDEDTTQKTTIIAKL